MKIKILGGMLALSLGLYLGWKDSGGRIFWEVPDKACEKKNGKRTGSGSAVATQPGVRMGELTRCPLSGVVIKVNEQTQKLTYKSQTYYTCCVTCTKRVAEDPEKYLN